VNSAAYRFERNIILPVLPAVIEIKSAGISRAVEQVVGLVIQLPVDSGEHHPDHGRSLAVILG